ncbi:MAG: V-type ATP synthase subunit E [Eubacteriales bacterium]|jgi:vacuolar-type H+-ATPase subunit E/Vma4
MINMEQKIAQFAKAVYADAEQQREAIQKEIEDIRSSELSSAEMALLESNYQHIQAEMTAIRNRYKQQISKEIFQYRKQLLAKREEILARVFDQVTRQVEKFTQSEDYLPSLIQTVEKAADSLGQSGLTIFLRPADMKFSPRIQQALPHCACTFQEDPSIVLGGALIKATRSNLLSDETYDFRMAQERESFVKESGLSVEVF